MSEKYLNLINGEWKAPSSNQYIENRNPADKNDLIGLFPASTEADVNEAVAAAKIAFEKWRLIPAPKRGDVLKVVGDMMLAKKDEISFEMTREMGKVFAETKGDT
ncbi:MAG TPA: aldehyde dehydrogenase family protein, partial [Ignavibacteria bacterium]|nr:aldehyde dehydrogenase family protein [Ignavibacteria bacterium]